MISECHGRRWCRDRDFCRTSSALLQQAHPHSSTIFAVFVGLYALAGYLCICELQLVDLRIWSLGSVSVLSVFISAAAAPWARSVAWGGTKLNAPSEHSNAISKRRPKERRMAHSSSTEIWWYFIVQRDFNRQATGGTGNDNSDDADDATPEDVSRDSADREKQGKASLENAKQTIIFRCDSSTIWNRSGRLRSPIQFSNAPNTARSRSMTRR